MHGCSMRVQPMKLDVGQAFGLFSHTPGTIADNNTGDVAADLYHQYPADIQLMQSSGIKNFRFSVAWSRIFPNGTGTVSSLFRQHYWNKLRAWKCCRAARISMQPEHFLHTHSCSIIQFSSCAKGLQLMEPCLMKGALQRSLELGSGLHPGLEVHALQQARSHKQCMS